MAELGIGIGLTLMGEIEALGIAGGKSTIAVATAAAVAYRMNIELGVHPFPMRPVVWVAAQIATLQHASGSRVVLGTGTDGFPGTPL